MPAVGERASRPADLLIANGLAGARDMGSDHLIKLSRPDLCSTMPARRSKSARRYPEALAPLSARGNALQLLVHAPVRQIEGVRDRRHGLEADEVPAWRRVNYRHRIFRAVRYRNLLLLALHRELGPPV